MHSTDDDDDNAMTPAKAELIGTVSAELLQVMFNAAHAHPDLHWTELAIAATTCLRGLAAHACAEDPALPLEMAKAMLAGAFMAAMELPDELVRIVRDDKPDGPVQTGIIPVRRH